MTPMRLGTAGNWQERALFITLLTALACGLFLPGVRAGAQQASAPPAAQTGQARPNILWITTEDNGPQYGIYGDSYATTPNIDKLAARGFRYRTVWSNGPVCGAARTAIITGVYPQSNGGEHMRSMVRLPEFMKLYPAMLHEAGYYTTNSNKTDYNFADIGTVWDEFSANAHWKNRKPGQPFFSIFNIMDSHESFVRRRPHTWEHDILKAPVPVYMPDVREVREDWAQVLRPDHRGGSYSWPADRRARGRRPGRRHDHHALWGSRRRHTAIQALPL